MHLVADREGMTGLLAGRAVRLLYDASKIDGDELSRRMGLALTPGVPPAEAAAWLDGVLSGGAMLLIHDPVLLGLLDRWIAVDPRGHASPTCCRCCAARSRTSRAPNAARSASWRAPSARRRWPAIAAGAEPPGFDRARADRALPVVRMLLGIKGTNQADV